MEIGERLGAVFARQAEAGVVSAYLFGSEAEGRAHRESDVDIGVLLAADRFPTAKARFEVRLRLAGDCTEALQGREVDLNVLNDVPPLLARHIVLRGQRIFCADPVADQRFVRKTILLAADLEPWLRHFRERKLHYLTTGTSGSSAAAASHCDPSTDIVSVEEAALLESREDAADLQAFRAAKAEFEASGEAAIPWRQSEIKLPAS